MYSNKRSWVSAWVQQMKRVLPLVLAMLLLCSCGVNLDLEEPAMPVQTITPVPEPLDLTPRREISPVLYFLNAAHTRLTAESRLLTIEDDESPEFAIVRAILEGPASPELHPVATELTVERVEVLPDLINVYLSTIEDALIGQRTLVMAKMAITAALVDYAGVRYVNVLLNGKQTGFTDDTTGVTIPTGALTRASDVTEELSQLELETAAASFDTNVALYFLDSTESFLLPEVTRLTYTQESDMVRELVSMLLRGPQSSYDSRPSLDSSLELLSHEVVEEPSGFVMLRLTFSRMPSTYTSNFTDGEKMAAASLTYTLTDYIPGIDGVELASRANPEQFTAYRPIDFADLPGNWVQVYLPNSSGGITMSAVDRLVPQAQADDPYETLRVLLNGPTDTDARDVWPAAPEGITVENVRDVYTAGDVIVVDLKSDVAQVLESGTAQEERALIFSIVNTLTAARGIRRVLFLQDGERTEYLGVRAICVLDPIMKDPGLIK